MGQEKGENSAMSYLNSITLVGFVGSDPEQRQAKGNGSKFTVLSVATQRSWKNADDEWSSKTEWHRVVVFRPLLAERVATTIKKGAHVLIEGSLVSSTYKQPNGTHHRTGDDLSMRQHLRDCRKIQGVIFSASPLHDFLQHLK